MGRSPARPRPIPPEAPSLPGIDVEVGPGDGRCGDSAPHDLSRRRSSGPLQLCRRPDAGRTVQGIGWALNEEYFFTADGTLANGSFLIIVCPRPWTPMIETVILEVPNPRHPFGLRGVGEAPIILPSAGPANAIYQAASVRGPAAHVTRRHPGSLAEQAALPVN